MTSSILESKYIEPTRPYSQLELSSNKEKLFKMLRLSDVKACHEECGHSYHVKKHSHKEKSINQTNDSDSGNCSVCWKLKNGHPKLRNMAMNLVDLYKWKFEKEPEYYTYDNIDLLSTYYKWLYE